MFGRHSKGFVQMYEYGCRNTVIGGLDAALDQMEGRVCLWNRFVGIERGIRQRARALLSDDAEYREIREIRERVAALRATVLQMRRAEGPKAPVVYQVTKATTRLLGQDSSTRRQHTLETVQARLLAVHFYIEARAWPAEFVIKHEEKIRIFTDAGCPLSTLPQRDGKQVPSGLFDALAFRFAHRHRDD